MTPDLSYLWKGERRAKIVKYEIVFIFSSTAALHLCAVKSQVPATTVGMIRTGTSIFFSLFFFGPSHLLSSPFHYLYYNQVSPKRIHSFNGIDSVYVE